MGEWVGISRPRPSQHSSTRMAATVLDIPSKIGHYPSGRGRSCKVFPRDTNLSLPETTRSKRDIALYLIGDV